MKKNTIYGILVVVFFAAIGMIVLKYNNDVKKEKAVTYELLLRKGVAEQTPEWKNARQHVTKLLQAVQKDPSDTKSMVALANLFILEARATGNYAYYDKAAMKYVNDALATDANNFDALTLKSLIYLSQHHFADGLAIAESAEKLNPYNAFLYGVMVDGHVEMGNYDSAVMSAEKMMEIRPDLRSYARASYLREIHGDYPGAIEAMKLAIDAGAPGDEATEWSRIQLGHLYENTGDMKNAALTYATALAERPGYAHAFAGLARIETAAKNYPKAIAYYEKADSVAGDMTFKEGMADVYTLMGNKEKAAAISKLVIDDMTINAVSAATDESLGHYADRELAYAYLKTGNTDKALEHALAEYNRRPKNIDVNETVAWVYYERGDYAKALTYITPAMKTNSKNPVLLSRAGLIFEKAGDTAKAKQCLEEALKNNPNIPELLKINSELALKKMSGLAKA